jgi:hypothetical protein
MDESMNNCMTHPIQPNPTYEKMQCNMTWSSPSANWCQERNWSWCHKRRSLMLSTCLYWLLCRLQVPLAHSCEAQEGERVQAETFVLLLGQPQSCKDQGN